MYQRKSRATPRRQKICWKDIQLILPKKGSSDFRKYTLKDDILFYDINKAANFINDYFVNIGPKLAQGFHSVWQFHGARSVYTLDNIVVQEMEVIDCCKKININKSSAIDNLSSKNLKIAFLTLSKKCTFILNILLSSKQVPKTWKIASVTPLFKSGSTSLCNK